MSKLKIKMDRDTKEIKIIDDSITIKMDYLDATIEIPSGYDIKVEEGAIIIVRECWEIYNAIETKQINDKLIEHVKECDACKDVLEIAEENEICQRIKKLIS